MQTILFRIEAGPGVGLGHLQRSLSLAHALTAQGVKSLFLCACTDESATAFANASGYKTIKTPESGSAEDISFLLEQSRVHDVCGVVVDSYKIQGCFLEQLSQKHFTAVIDDLADRDMPVHCIINANLHSEALTFQCKPDTRLLLGPQYAMLKPEFADCRQKSIASAVQKLLITMGGADHFHIVPELISALDAFSDPWTVQVVIGPFADNQAAILEAAERSHHTVELIESATSLKTYFEQADVAISAGGQTLYELAATGTPTLAIELVDNQRPQLQAFTDQELLLHIGHVKDPNLGRNLRGALQQVCHNKILRQRISRKAQSVIDGNGAQRVASVLKECLYEHVV